MLEQFVNRVCVKTAMPSLWVDAQFSIDATKLSYEDEQDGVLCNRGASSAIEDGKYGPERTA